MSKPKFIVLDSYPLANAALVLNKSQAKTTESYACRQWMEECEKSGSRLLVPAIAYYEVVREISLREARYQFHRFQDFCFDPERFVPLTTNHLTEAAQLWAQVRRTGFPTADRHSLDGDAILAAQTLSLNLEKREYIVASKNSKHLSKFGLSVQEWQSI